MDETILQVTDNADFLVVSDPLSDILVTTDTLVVTNEEVSFVTVGIQGPAGADADANYVHTQVSSSSVWTVNHNLGKRPSVTVVDSGDTVVVGDVSYIDDDNIIINFTSPFGGKCYIN